MISKELISKVDKYQPLAARLQTVADTQIILIVGISGAGKDAITNELLSQYPNIYKRFVTHTTRRPRVNHGLPEQNGREYYFIDLDVAERMVNGHDFIEANVYSGNIYGTSIAELERAHTEHKVLISDIDVNGVAHLAAYMPNSKPIFILPPSFDTWQQRFVMRYAGSIDEEDRRHRMHTAYLEIVHALAHDYFYLVVNDDLERVATEIHNITVGKHLERRSRHAVKVAEMILTELRKFV